MLSRTNSAKQCHSNLNQHSSQGFKIWLFSFKWCLLLAVAMLSGQANSTATLLNPSTVPPSTVQSPFISILRTPLDEKQHLGLTKQQKHFIVAVGQDSFPYQFATSQGKADGLLGDIWTLGAKKNVKVQIK